MRGVRARAAVRARPRLWVAGVVAATAAMVLAPSAAAATATVVACDEIPLGYAITFSGTGFAANAVVSGFENGSFRGITQADGSGRFSDFALLVFSLPSEISFVDTAGNTAVVTVTECARGGGTQPASKAECKKGGYGGFTDPAYTNQGRCVSAVASKSK